MGVLREGGLSFSGDAFFELWRLCQQPLFVIGVVLYGLAALVWVRVISTEDLATGYVLLVSTAFIAVTIGAHFIFREPMTVQKLIGMAVIVTGIIIVGRS
jgi:multidrug transporter EmrE-like cation transporter